jgi:hypothetical protein
VLAVVLNFFMALLSFRGISTPSLQAQGEQRRFSYFNIGRDNSSSISRHYNVLCKPGSSPTGENENDLSRCPSIFRPALAFE